MTSYHVRWLVTDKVILVELSGVINLTVALAVTGELVTMFDATASASVHMIVNVQQAVSMPRLSEIRRLQSTLRHPKLDWIVLVGEDVNVLVKLTTSVALQIARIK